MLNDENCPIYAGSSWPPLSYRLVYEFHHVFIVRVNALKTWNPAKAGQDPRNFFTSLFQQLTLTSQKLKWDLLMSLISPFCIASPCCDNWRSTRGQNCCGGGSFWENLGDGAGVIRDVF